MKIQVGEYVRTKGGIIAKVIGVQSGGIEKYYFDKEVHNLFNYLNGLAVENVVLKHSFNIIDLIQKGDIVNGFKVFGIYNREVDGVKVVSNTPDEDFYNESVSNEEIYSVLTKEQFKAMEYEVK